jgi:hypothetical protein
MEARNSTIWSARAVLFIVTWFADPRICAGQSDAEVIKIVNLERQELTTYDEPKVDGRRVLGSTLVCYSDNPERFLFLYTTSDGYLGFHVAEPRLTRICP